MIWPSSAREERLGAEDFQSPAVATAVEPAALSYVLRVQDSSAGAQLSLNASDPIQAMEGASFPSFSASGSLLEP